MSEGIDPEVLAELVNSLGRDRGYASFHQWPDRQIMERGIVADVVDLAPSEFPVPFQLVSQDPDPPDCVLTHEDLRIGVEVTELVDQSFLKAVIRAKRSPGGGTVYDWASWEREKFVALLKERIHAKAYPSQIHGGPFDEYLLVIHTAEPGLEIEMVEAWLAEGVEVDRGRISRAFILFDYRPDADRLVLRVPLGVEGAGEA